MIRTWHGPARACWRWLRRSMAAVGMASAALGLPTGATAQPAMHSVGPVPAWVEPVAPEESAPPSEQVSDGVQYLLFDTQVRVDGADRVHFRHVAAKALSERGVESVANVQLRFDPSYQKLTLHAINLRRGGRVITKLSTVQVKVLQREAALESLIYDGTRTANVFLDDVRVGDVVEYAYSLRGHNSVFGARQFGAFDLQYGVPVNHLHARLLWPAGRNIHWRHHNQAAMAKVADTGTHSVYSWDLRGVAARVVDPDAPSWFDPYPWVQWGEFADWGVVRDWALPLYDTSAAPGRRVRAAIAHLAEQHEKPPARLAAALRYVQSEIRYLGIEVGAGSHAPNPPDLVMERRYGDCKDKTLLLLTLLRGLGVDAAPALVHTGLRHGIEAQLPSPGAFNHVLVRARLDGQDYWLDPTSAPQRGGLAQIAQADFGRALLVERGTRELNPMAGEQARLQRREVRVTIDTRDGVGKPARYTVATTAHGAAAESLRATLNAQSRENMQKQYLNFYSGYFGPMDVSTPFVVEDDPQANRLTVTEHYVLKEFWKRNDTKSRIDGQIEVPDLSEYLRQPRSLVRNAPLSLNHPARLDLVTEVRLPEEWSIEPETARVEDAAFRFERKVQWDERLRSITFSDQYLSLADHVPPDQMARYADNLEKARIDASYVIYRHDSAPASAGGGSIYWLPAVLGTLSLVGCLWAAQRLYHWDPPPRADAQSIWLDKPDPIGGWLILPALGLPLGILSTGKALVDLWPSLSTDTWMRVADPSGGAYHPLFGPLLIFETVANLAGLVGLALLMVLLYQRRTSLPRLYVVIVPGLALCAIVDVMMGGLIPAADVGGKEWAGALRQLLFAALWATYFLRAERVQRTFLLRRDRAVGAPATPPAPGGGPAPVLDSPP